MKKWIAVVGLTVLGVGWLLVPAKKNSAAADGTPAPAATPEAAAAPRSFSKGGATPTVDVTPGPPTNSLFKRILAGEKALVTVPLETVRAYLRSNGFSAESLLVAFQATTNRDYLIQAATNYPHDPRVQFAVLMHNTLPEQRSTWVARFKQDAPDNALPSYIAARDAFKAQQPQLALQELASANDKPHYRDYVVENIQAFEELYLANGQSPAEAKLAGMANVLMPHLGMLRDLAKDEMDLQKRYAAAGDHRSADLMAMDAVRLGRQLSSGEGAVSLLSQMIGVSIESSVLKEYPSDAQPSFLSTSAQERLAQLQQQRQSIREGANFWQEWLGTASENEVIAYFDRMKLYGEPGAVTWLQNRLGAAGGAQ